MAAYFGRLVASAVIFAVYFAMAILINAPQTLIVGAVAGSQFESGDLPYLRLIGIGSGFGLAHAVLLFAIVLALVATWWGPLKKLWAVLAVILIAGIVIGGDARAFYEKTERTEAYTIMPNESAFWIPDVGDNKANQAQLESEAYLNEKKLAVKRFIIPHAKLSNTGGYLGWDFYVPTGRLILVDRTPFSREWVDAEDRGTGKKKEGFPCQSKEGLNIIAGVSIGTSVLERDAAKFLYRFGVNPPRGQKGELLDRTAPEVIFTSVYYGRSLREVMDDVGRKKVQTLVCAEIASRTFDKANDEANTIMAAVEKNARDYFASVGVTLDFIGWGDTFEFDKDVQKAVNDKYAASKLAEVMPILQALAQIKIQEGMGKGMGDKGLPIVVTPGMIEALANAMRPAQ